MARRLKRAAAANDVAAVPDLALDEAAAANRPGYAALVESARRSLLDAVPETALALADGAKEGSVPHIKLLLQLVGLDEGGLASQEGRPPEKTLEEILLEQWAKEP